MNKQQCEGIIKSFNPRITYSGYCDQYSHEAGILIGDVLEKIHKEPYRKAYMPSIKILELWSDCGFNKSLQQIMEDSGFAPISHEIFKHAKCGGMGCDECVNGMQSHAGKLKDPNAINLFTFLGESLPSPEEK